MRMVSVQDKYELEMEYIQEEKMVKQIVRDVFFLGQSPTVDY